MEAKLKRSKSGNEDDEEQICSHVPQDLLDADTHDCRSVICRFLWGFERIGFRRASEAVYHWQYKAGMKGGRVVDLRRAAQSRGSTSFAKVFL
jgi:hypothetical protein